MSSPTLASGKLNGFQQMMLQWNELHPYNAVHVVRWAQALDLERLQAAINAVLAEQGLVDLHLDVAKGVYDYGRGTATLSVARIGGPDPALALAAEVERQLNTRFNIVDRFSPFRFFVVPANRSFAFGLSYFHPVADAEAIVRLLKAILARYGNGASNRLGLEVYPPRFDRGWQQPSVLLKKLSAWPRMLRDMRSSCRPAYRNPADMNNAFVLFSLPGGALDAVIKTSKSWGVTVNDLFLGLLLKTLSPLASKRKRGDRQRLTVGCIVNTRKDLLPQSDHVFGLFLGSFTVTHAMPDGISLADLAKDIRRATEFTKQKKLYLGMPLEMVFGGRLLPLFSVERRKKLYPKHYPLWGGITNMNLNALWEQQGSLGSFDYFRAVSTGPVTPLVLSVTTVGDAINVGLTYRTTVFEPGQVEGIKNGLIDAVVAL